ncbi:MAG: retroviral-like aspartic protease family protein [Candidatus Eremiobacteraeota bacterium]|nr:retroviral-like aspartic protease family protein [Candidatus Eremiobacteraeota bacterium]
MMHRVLSTAAFAAFAALVVVAAPQTAPAGAADAGSVLAKHKAYMGWSYGDGALKTARITTVAVVPSPAPGTPAATPDPLGKADGKFVELRRELLYRADEKAYGIGFGSTGFTGSVFWASNSNGNVVTRRLRSARKALTEDVIDAEAFGEVPTTLRSDANFDGKSSAVVRLEPKTGVPADVYFDRDTGAMRGYVLDPDVAPERRTLHVVSYAEFAPGKRYVASYRFNDSKTLVKVVSFEPNAAVSDADLHPPVPTDKWTFAEPKPVPIEIVSHSSVYSNSGGRAVHVEVAVNGHVGHFLFDSGAGGMIVFDPFAKSLNLKELGRTSYTGVNGGGVEATLARAETIRIGGSTLHDAVITHGKGMEDSKLDGIVGFDVLAGSIAEVNLVNKTLTIRDPEGYQAAVPQGAYAFSIDMSDFEAGVPVKVNDAVLPSVWLDTGNDFFVILPHELEKKTVALANTITVAGQFTFDQTVYFGGVDGAGAEPARCVRLNEIQVGPYRYQKALSCFAPNDTFGADGGLIGFDFLRHFNWTFDYPHGKVVLTPNGL